MAANMADRVHVRQVELAIECVAITDEVDRLLQLAVQRVATLKGEARTLAGELDGAGERV
jgi:hypothetical protein